MITSTRLSSSLPERSSAFEAACCCAKISFKKNLTSSLTSLAQEEDMPKNSKNLIFLGGLNEISFDKHFYNSLDQMISFLSVSQMIQQGHKCFMKCFFDLTFTSSSS